MDNLNDSNEFNMNENQASTNNNMQDGNGMANMNGMPSGNGMPNMNGMANGNGMPNMNGMQNMNGMPNGNGMPNMYGNNMNSMYNGGRPYQQVPVKRTSKGAIAAIIGIFVLLTVIVFVGSFVIGFLAATTEKEKITTNEFMEECSDKALEIEDVTSTEAELGLVKAYKATNTAKDYTITFYEFDTTQNATSCFEFQKKAMELAKANNGVATSGNFKNFANYSVTAHGKFMYATYVDNTVLYAEGSSSDKTEIKELIDELDY